MGDTIDNIKGVPGIGEKGARELIATYGSLENLIAHAAEIPQKRYREPLLANIDDGAAEPASSRAIRTDVPVEFDPDALRYRGASRERSFRDLQRARLPHSRRRNTRRPPSTITKTYRIVNTPEDVQRAGRAADGGGALRPARAAGPAVAPCARRSSAWRSRPRRAMPTTCPPAIARSATTARCRCDDGARRAASRCSKTIAIAQDRPRPEVRRHPARAARRRRCAGSTPTRCSRSYLIDATRSEHRLEDLALEHTSYKALTRRRRLRPRRQGACRWPTCRPKRRSITPASAPISPDSSRRFFRDLLEQEQLTDVYETLELPLIPVLVAVERAGVRIDGPALAAQSQQVEQELARRTATDLRDRRRRVQHQLAQAARRRSCSTSCSCPF